ncbi:MAG: RrF2 family transcriptional regulator [Pseudomonadota bacterium]|jgi:Rrf2 family nitric oxide-sensitive transcriptional repressor
MRLTLHTDYALRALIFLARADSQTATAGEIAAAYGVSRNHLVKVLQGLRDQGHVETSRGRHGGVRLAVDPQQLRLGDVVRQTEPLIELVECFNPQTNTCPLSRVCRLKRVLAEALSAYLEVLDAYTLADVTANGAELDALLGR